MPTPHSRNTVLSLRILAGILITSFVITALAVLWHLYDNYQKDSRKLEERLDHIAKSALTNISLSIWNYDQEQLNVQLQSLQSLPEIARVEVFQSDPEEGEQELAFGNEIEDLPTIKLDYPLRYKAADGTDHDIGKLIIFVSLEGVQADLRSEFLRIVLFQSLKTFVLSGVILLLIHLLIIRHIDKIARYASELSMATIDTPLELERKDNSTTDELDQLAEAINTMRETMITDINSQKAYEASIAQEKINSLKERENAQLEKARSDEKSKLLATMSHEIRTPVNGILGMAELLSIGELNNTQKQYADIIQSSSKTLLSVVNDILDYSKIEAGKEEFASEAINLEDLFIQTAAMFTVIAREKGLRFRFFIDPKCAWHVYGDLERLQQVLNNLLGNAVKFTPAGAIKLSLHPGKTTEAGKAQIIVKVEDTGIGIKAENIAKVFKNFSQADRSITRKYGGTGLGLSICKELVNGMGGDIGVHSELGKGSEFSFYLNLPVDDAAEKAKREQFTGLKGKRILVVIGDDYVAECIKQYIGYWGAQVSTASSFSEVLALPDATRFDSILTASPTVHEACDDDQHAFCHIPVPILLVENLSLCGFTGLSDTYENVTNVNLPCSITYIIAQLAKLTGVICKPTPNGIAKTELKSIPELKGMRVLVAEDNEINRQVIAAILRKLGVRAEFAEDGQIAIDRYTKEPQRFDLVFMDCEMPNVDGYTATQQIRGFEVGADISAIPVVALTAHAMSDHRQKCLDVGMNDVLTKPLNIASVQSALSEFILQ